VIYLTFAIDWTHHEVLSFWYLVTPEVIHDSLEKASPLLFRTIVGLGSYPWQNYPLDRLTWASLHFVTRVTCKIRPYSRSEPTIYRYCYRDKWGPWPRLDQDTLLILFQSMTSIGFPNKHKDVDELGREVDDKPVSELIQFLRSCCKRNPKWPVQVKRRFDLDQASFPPSNWRYQGGRISHSALKDLIEILVSLAIYELGIDSCLLLQDKAKLRGISNTLFETFHRESLSKSGKVLPKEELNFITWQTFQHVITMQMVCIFAILIMIYPKTDFSLAIFVPGI
jgi:hypothetical protein